MNGAKPRKRCGPLRRGVTDPVGLERAVKMGDKAENGHLGRIIEDLLHGHWRAVKGFLAGE